jgi:hypothetical protein
MRIINGRTGRASVRRSRVPVNDYKVTVEDQYLDIKRGSFAESDVYTVNGVLRVEDGVGEWDTFQCTSHDISRWTEEQREVLKRHAAEWALNDDLDIAEEEDFSSTAEREED